MLITADELKTLVQYNPATGDFFWRNNGKGRRKSRAAGSLNKGTGYHELSLKNKRFSAHRMAWLYMTGEPPKGQIDHINGIRNDNRWSNLRDVTPQQNSQNRHHVRSKAGFIGVTKSGAGFKAQIRIGNKGFYLGTFKTPELAAKIYAQAKKHIHSLPNSEAHLIA